MLQFSCTPGTLNITKLHKLGWFQVKMTPEISKMRVEKWVFLFIIEVVVNWSQWINGLLKSKSTNKAKQFNINTCNWHSQELVKVSKNMVLTWHLTQANDISNKNVNILCTFFSATKFKIINDINPKSTLHQFQTIA